MLIARVSIGANRYGCCQSTPPLPIFTLKYFATAEWLNSNSTASCPPVRSHGCPPPLAVVCSSLPICSTNPNPGAPTAATLAKRVPGAASDCTIKELRSPGSPVKTGKAMVWELMAGTLTAATLLGSGPEPVVRENSTVAFTGLAPKFARGTCGVEKTPGRGFAAPTGTPVNTV